MLHASNKTNKTTHDFFFFFNFKICFVDKNSDLYLKKL